MADIFYGRQSYGKRYPVSKEARDRLLRGAELLMESVKGTLGPCGHHVVIQKEKGLPCITNDGVSIAKSLRVRDPYEQMGMQILLDSAVKTNETSGDGTTTSILLAYELLKHGFQYMENGGVAKAFVSGMEEAAAMIETFIIAHAQKSIRMNDWHKLPLSVRNQRKSAH